VEADPRGVAVPSRRFVSSYKWSGARFRTLRTSQPISAGAFGPAGSGQRHMKAGSVELATQAFGRSEGKKK